MFKVFDKKNLVVGAIEFHAWKSHHLAFNKYFSWLLLLILSIFSLVTNKCLLFLEVPKT